MVDRRAILLTAAAVVEHALAACDPFNLGIHDTGHNHPCQSVIAGQIALILVCKTPIFIPWFVFLISNSTPTLTQNRPALPCSHDDIAPSSASQPIQLHPSLQHGHDPL